MNFRFDTFMGCISLLLYKWKLVKKKHIKKINKFAENNLPKYTVIEEVYERRSLHRIRVWGLFINDVKISRHDFFFKSIPSGIYIKKASFKIICEKEEGNLLWRFPLTNPWWSFLVGTILTQRWRFKVLFVCSFEGNSPTCDIAMTLISFVEIDKIKRGFIICSSQNVVKKVDKV